jgi:hypothetical protein
MAGHYPRHFLWGRGQSLLAYGRQAGAAHDHRPDFHFVYGADRRRRRRAAGRPAAGAGLLAQALFLDPDRRAGVRPRHDADAARPAGRGADHERARDRLYPRRDFDGGVPDHCRGRGEVFLKGLTTPTDL